MAPLKGQVRSGKKKLVNLNLELEGPHINVMWKSRREGEGSMLAPYRPNTWETRESRDGHSFAIKSDRIRQ